MLKSKKVIVLGDKDGIPGSIIESCIKMSGAEVVFNSTTCFSCSISGTIDEETNQEIKQITEKYGEENIIVILGCAEADTSTLIVRTITESILGENEPDAIHNLSGAEFGMNIYHMLEPEIKDECNSTVYDKHCKVMEIVLDSDKIIKELKSIRELYLRSN